jgi:acetoin utilization deacetylase AcuC-like enzyme
MPKFATYLHPSTTLTTKPAEQINFVGHSYPYFSQIRQGLAELLGHYPALPARQAAVEDYLTVHHADYLQKITRLAADEPVDELPNWSVENSGLAYTLPGLLYGLGGLLEAVDQMKASELERAYCFSLGGHHAFADWGHGYCILNPQAAAARYAQAQGFEKILIVDWDLHHGDGTQSIFTHDPSVYCLSIHSGADLYMTTQRVLRLGTTTAAKEAGHYNIPLLHSDYDDTFWAHMKLPGKYYRTETSLGTLQAALEALPWTPDLVFVFSGYDSHQDDQGKDVTNWTNEDYDQLTRLVLRVARKANCPIISSHGGGYTLSVALAAAVCHTNVLVTE